MITATTEITQPSQAQPERFPGQPHTLVDDWKNLQEHNEPKPKAEKAEPQKDEPKTVDIAKLTAEQQEKWQKDGEFPKAEAKKEAETPAAEAKPVGDEGKQAVKADADAKRQPQSAMDRFLERASKEPEFEKVVQRMNEPFFPMNREGFARYQVLGKALGEVVNREDVLYFLSRPENSEIAFKMQSADAHKIAAVVHTISAELRFGRQHSAASEAPKPRAPKPPTEVGGRGTAPPDEEKEALRTNDFARASAVWDRQLRGGKYKR